jgi:RNA polymerase sigma factor (sigma-70 family)
MVIAEAALSKNKLGTQHDMSEVVTTYTGRLQSFIRKRVNTVEDAEDILQDVFYQLVEAESYLKPIDQLTAWIYTVTRNRITDWYRKKKTELLPDFSDDEDDSILFELKELLFDNGSTPETEYLRSLVWTELEEALTQLPEEQRIVFELTEMKGLSFKEIAEQTGEQVNTLISRKRYAVLFLRQRLQVLYDDLLNF